MTIASPKQKELSAFDSIMYRLTALAIVALTSTVIWHEVRLGIIENTEFSATEAIKMERRLQDDINPAWLKSDIQELKTLIKDCIFRVTRLESKVETLHREDKPSK